MPYANPPTWLILLVAIGLLALPSSAVMGLAGWFVYRRLFERHSLGS
jgi:hypothetical protein